MIKLYHRSSKIGFLTFLILFTLAPTVAVHAKDSYTINQKDHKFSELFLKLKSDDVIKFVNLDSVDHRLIFKYKDRQEQMNVINPGKSQEVTFSNSGVYDVQCKFHPEMKLTIFVPHVTKLTKSDSIYVY